MDHCTRGIPVGKYNVTARIILANGEMKPGRVVAYDGLKGQDAAPAAGKFPLIFIQTKAPSDNLNNVVEMNLPVMY
jgi:hypothetical protein